LPTRGFEPARGADEQEEKGDAREPVRPEPRRKGRSPGWAEAQAGESPLRRQSFPNAVHGDLNANSPPTSRRKSATYWSASGERAGREGGGVAAGASSVKSPLPSKIPDLNAPQTPPHSRTKCAPWGTPQRIARGAPHSRTKCAPWGTPQRIARGAPHSRMNCAPWGIPQQTLRGTRLMRANPPRVSPPSRT
jgi:hypothetical protein